MAYNSKYTGQEVENLLGKINDKQDTISDLASIREGAAKGATALQSIPEEYVTEADLEDKDYAPMSVLDNKVDKVSGKGLSTEDFTSALKAKLESLSNYNDAEITDAVSSLQTQINTLVSGNADDAINSFNEIIAFLAGVKDSEDLDNIIASIERQIAEKQDIISDLATIRTNASKGATAVQSSSLASVATSGSYNDLTNKPAIPTKTSELTNDSTFITSADNVASATKLQTMRYINGSPFDGTANAVSYAVCATGASTTAKTVSISRFSLATGSQVRVKFSNANTASAPTLNVGSTGAKRMSYKGSLITNANFSFSTAKIYTFTYDGTYWVLEGNWDEAPKNFSDLSNNDFITCEFMGEVGDVIWSDDDTNRVAYIHEWMEELSNGKVCVLDFDDYEGTYAMVYAINYRSHATFGLGISRFSYVFEGYLYEVEYDEVVLPVTITIVNKTKIGGEGGSSEGGSSAYSEINHGTSDTTFELTPNTFHVWDEVASLDLSLGAETSGVANEYLFQFTSGSTPTTLTLPDNIKFSEDLVIEANKIYQISILKGLGSVLSWDNAPALIENKATITSSGNKATVTLQYAAASSLSIKVIHDDGSNTITIPVGEVSGSVNIMSPMIFNLRISTITPEFDTNYIYVK